MFFNCGHLHSSFVRAGDNILKVYTHSVNICHSTCVCKFAGFFVCFLIGLMHSIPLFMSSVTCTCLLPYYARYRFNVSLADNPDPVPEPFKADVFVIKDGQLLLKYHLLHQLYDNGIHDDLFD